MLCYHTAHSTRSALGPSLRIVGLSALLLSLLSLGVLAQRIVEVPQGVGTLNEAVDGDTTATGERIDLNTVYVLERDGVYLTTSSLENRDYPLTIVAADGEGARPIVQPAVLEGGESSRPFTPRNDLTLRGLYVTNEDELGGRNTRIIRVRADSAVVIIEDCHLDKDAQSALRLDNDWISVTIKNSVISNIGQTASLDNGRGVDTRGNNVELIRIEYSTFYNITSRIIRDGGGFIKNHVFNHNTAVNVGQHFSTPGEVQMLTFTNNLIVNPGFIGSNENRFSGRVWLGIDSLAVDSLGNPLRDGPQEITIRNNYFVVPPAVLEAYGDSVSSLPFGTPTTLAFIEEAGTMETNVVDTLIFPFFDAPDVPVQLIQARWQGVADEELPPLDQGDGGVGVGQEQLPFDFGYPDGTEVASTGSTAGMPLGDWNWLGLAIPTPNEIDPASPHAFRLLGNYPNPFNPSTNVRLSLPFTAEVGVRVYDLTGREVLTVAPQLLPAGDVQTVRIDAAGLASGVYLYRVTATDGARSLVRTGRMVLMR